MTDLDKIKIMDFLQSNKKIIQETYSISEIGLFGSYITDQNSKSSDVDILIVFKQGGETFKNYMKLKFFLEENFRRKVDLVIKKTNKERLKDRILAETKYA